MPIAISAIASRSASEFNQPESTKSLSARAVNFVEVAKVVENH